MPRIRLRKQVVEKHVVESVYINGTKYTVRSDSFTDVPEGVASILKLPYVVDAPKAKK